MEPEIKCPFCNGNVSGNANFCPTCGKKIKEKALPTGILTQTLIYLLSFFLAPLGLWPAIKYLKQKGRKEKNIGLVALIITIIAILVAGYITLSLFNTFGNSFGSQIQMYQDLQLY